MTMISSTRGLLCSASMVCSMIGRPAILMSCFGMLSPTRLPTPPARMTATLRRSFTRPTLPARDRATCPASEAGQALRAPLRAKGRGGPVDPDGQGRAGALVELWPHDRAEAEVARLERRHRGRGDD